MNKAWFYCKKCHRWSYQIIMTSNRCPYCGSVVTMEN